MQSAMRVSFGTLLRLGFGPKSGSFNLKPTMDSFSSPHPNFLDASPLLKTSSIGGPDLSLSDLTISDLPTRPLGAPRSSIFAETPQPAARYYDPETAIAEDEEEQEGRSLFDDEEEEGNADETVLARGGLTEGDSVFLDRGEERLTSTQKERAREDKLRAALLALRQMNGVFSSYLDALRAADDKNRVSRSITFQYKEWVAEICLLRDWLKR